MKTTTPRLLFLILAATSMLRFPALAAPPPASAEPDAAHRAAAAKGRAFLTGLLNPDLGLLPEYRGARVYWLYHDNYLAAKVLAESHPEVAGTIRSAIEREGVRESGKIEILFGESPRPLPFRLYELTDVRRAGDKVIRTEVVKPEVMEGWSEYADLLLLACIAETDRAEARRHWDAAIRLWDGKGFLDPAARHHGRYATYKLALALLAAATLDPRPDPPEGLFERLLAVQNEEGGWITDYLADDTPVGFANVETTSLAILGIESALDREPSNPPKSR